MALPTATSFQAPESGLDPSRTNELQPEEKSRSAESPQDFFQSLLAELIELEPIEAGQVWGLNAIGACAKIASTNANRFQSFEQKDVVKKHQDLISQTLFHGKTQVIEFQEANGTRSQSRQLMLAPIFLEQESVGIFELILGNTLSTKERSFVEERLRQASQYLNARVQAVDEPDVVEEKSPSSAGLENQNLEASRRTEVKDPPKRFPPKRFPPKRFPPESFEPKRFEPKRFELPSPENRLVDVSDQPPTDSGSVSPNQEVDDRLDSDLDVESFVLLLHNQNDFAYVAETATTESRRLIGCDRVSVATNMDGVVNVAAVSGQDDLAKKSNMIRAMEELANYVIQTGKEVGFDPSDRDSEQSHEMTAKYIEESGASWLKVIPLFEPEKIDFDSEVHHSDQTPFGALFLEQFTSRTVPDSQAIARLIPHIAQATFHAAQQEQVFLLPLRRRVGGWAKKAKLTRTKAAIGACLLFVASMVLAFVEVPYSVEATGRLMPVQQFRAYAPFDGQVERVLVTSGQAVAQNQPLIKVTNESLKAKHLSLNNNLVEKTKLLAAYKAQLNETAQELSTTASVSLNTKIVQLGLEIEGLKRQLTLQEFLMERSLIRSNIAGTVATFQPGDVLNGRPIGRGELLLEVMNEMAEWQLELTLPEKRYGHLVDQIGASRSPLTVSFAQATNPEHSFEAAVDHIATRVTVAENGVASVSMHAAILPDQSFKKTIGTEVIAKINCGKRSLGYAWFGDIVDWFRQTSWRIN